jgi:hypothetical protein
MTESEHIALVERGNEFWREFSELCNRYIAAAPEHLRDEYIEYLGEKTSIWGRRK